ncbi:MAG: flavodoxin [Lachnospiraceae bacterium]|nr:flavodoxin [Lachnospiraceae bacterium]
MKTAVVFYSMFGNTEYAAEKIAAQLDADLIRVEPEKAYPTRGLRKFLVGGKGAVSKATPALKPYQFEAEAYGRVVIGMPVWASSVTPPINTFVKDNLEALRGKKIAAFVSSKGGGPEKALEKLRLALGIDAFEAELSLIEPKGKPDAASEMRITAFCNALKEE